jgi:hypothetical protein
VYDADHRCGANQVLAIDGRHCACVVGSVATEHGCQLCGNNEVPGEGKCDCVTGYSRPTPEAACVLIPTGLGVACDTVDAPCADVNFPACHPTGGTTGYCTSLGCVSHVDCLSGYACDTTATPTYCKRPPTGTGRSCQSNADCAGTEATFCDLMISRQCLVQGCTTTPDSCFPGTECCDLTTLGMPALCVKEGACRI